MPNLKVREACCFDEYDAPATADEIRVVAGSPKYFDRLPDAPMMNPADGL